MNYATLKQAHDDWLATTPNPATDAAFLAWLAATVTVERGSLTGGEIFNAIVPTEWNGLTDANRQIVRDIFGLGTVDISTGTNARTALLSVFTNGTTTRTNLGALVAKTQTRAEQYGLGVVGQPHLDRARLDGVIE